MLALLIYINFPNLKSHFGFIEQNILVTLEDRYTEWKHFKTRNGKVYLVSSRRLHFIQSLRVFLLTQHASAFILFKVTSLPLLGFTD